MGDAENVNNASANLTENHQVMNSLVKRYVPIVARKSKYQSSIKTVGVGMDIISHARHV